MHTQSLDLKPSAG